MNFPSKPLFLRQLIICGSQPLDFLPQQCVGPIGQGPIIETARREPGGPQLTPSDRPFMVV